MQNRPYWYKHRPDIASEASRISGLSLDAYEDRKIGCIRLFRYGSEWTSYSSWDSLAKRKLEKTAHGFRHNDPEKVIGELNYARKKEKEEADQAMEDMKRETINDAMSIGWKERKSIMVK